MACKVMWYGGLTDNKKLCKWSEFFVILEFEERFSYECKIYIWCFITFLHKKLHEWNLRFVAHTGMGMCLYLLVCRSRILWKPECYTGEMRMGPGMGMRVTSQMGAPPPPRPWHTDMPEKITFSQTVCGR